MDVMVAVGPNMFYTVTLPCTLWFLDKGKVRTPRADKVLFLDARHIYRQIDRAHRDWTPAQIGFLANVVRLYGAKKPDFTLVEMKPAQNCEKSSARSEVRRRARSLQGIDAEGNRSARLEAKSRALRRVAPGEEVSDEDFKVQLETLNEELETLNAQARELGANHCRECGRNS